MMPIKQSQLTIMTKARGTQEITADLQAQIAAWRSINEGVLNVFIQHTSAGLLITENADDGVRRDLERWLLDAIPDGDNRFEHNYEGPDDMPAHIRTVLTETTLNIPVAEGRLQLGTWQGVYLYEHRHAGHQRRVFLTLMH